MKRVEKLAEQYAGQPRDAHWYNRVPLDSRVLTQSAFEAGYRQALEDAAKLMTVHIDCPNCHAPGLTVDFGYLIRALADEEEEE